MCKDISRNTLLDTHFIAIFSNHWKHYNPRKNVFYTIFLKDNAGGKEMSLTGTDRQKR